MRDSDIVPAMSVDDCGGGVVVSTGLGKVIRSEYCRIVGKDESEYFRMVGKDKSEKFRIEKILKVIRKSESWFSDGIQL
jgi:hypothetical protein